MARKFTMVTFNGESVLRKGFVTKSEVEDIQELQICVANTAEYESIDLKLMYFVYIEEPNKPIEDATDDEMLIIDEYLEDLYEEELIVLIDMMETRVYGVNKDMGIIESGDIL